MPKQKADCLINGGLVLTMDEANTIYDSGSVAVKDSRIIALGNKKDIDKNYTATNKIEAKDHIVMPGLINTHTHIPMTLFRGLADDLNLLGFLERLFPLESAILTRERVELGALLGITEMVQGGTTCCMDMYWHPEMTAAVAKKIGFRLVAGTVFVDFPGFDGLQTLTERSEHAEWFINEYADDPLITPGVFPLGEHLMTSGEIEHTLELSSKYDCPVQIHAAETNYGVQEIEKRLGSRPIEILGSMGLLSRRLVIAHGVHLSAREIELLAETETSISHCLISNLKLIDGIAPVKALTEAGVNVTLGTDGPSSSNDLDLWKVIRTAAIVHKTINDDAGLNSARDMIKMATLNGAKALNMDDEIGSLEVGKKADIILIDTRKPHLTPMYDPYSILVYAAGREDVDSVMVNGQWVMKHREMTAVDPFEIMAEVNSAARSFSVA